MQVVIVDTRAEWMIAEDKLFQCMNRCSMWRRCQTRAGVDCKRLGGDIIPKIR